MMRVHFIQHVPFENPGTLLQWVKKKEYQIHVTRVFNDEPFPAADSYNLLIIMGGPMGLHQEKKFKWMTAEKNCIEEAIREKKWVLGICLGAQLIASVLGAGVFAHVEQEIGWWPIYASTNHPLSNLLTPNFHAFHWHGDTFDLPHMAQQLFYSNACSQQGFIYDNHVLALQFHPEIEMHLLLQMLQHGKHELTNTSYVQSEHLIIKQTEKFLPDQFPFLQELMDRFLISAEQ
jgi:GMP synthase-like glutamine amidotransferase